MAPSPTESGGSRDGAQNDESPDSESPDSGPQSSVQVDLRPVAENENPMDRIVHIAGHDYGAYHSLPTPIDFSEYSRLEWQHELFKACLDGAPCRTAFWLGAPSHVLDVGAGTGTWAAHIAIANPETQVTAADMTSALKTEFMPLNADFQVFDVVRDIRVDWVRSFDFVHMRDVIGITSWSSALSNTFGFLKPGGYFEYCQLKYHIIGIHQRSRSLGGQREAHAYAAAETLIRKVEEVASWLGVTLDPKNEVLAELHHLGACDVRTYTSWVPLTHSIAREGGMLETAKQRLAATLFQNGETTRFAILRGAMLTCSGYENVVLRLLLTAGIGERAARALLVIAMHNALIYGGRIEM